MVSIARCLALIASVVPFAATAQDPSPAEVEAAAAAAAPDVAPEWRFSVNEHGLRLATAQGIAHYGSTRWPAELRLQCAPGGDGTLSWQLHVAAPEGGDGFDFDVFEGPDAPAGKLQLSQLALEGGLLTTRFASKQAGWWSPERRFVFDVNQPAWSNDNGALLADAVGAQTRAILWSLRAPKDASQVIVARFDATGAAPVLRDAMQGCGPPPPLDAKALEGWTNDATAMWRDRAITWRLRGLLGAQYDAFATQRWPDRLQRDGAVYFLTADADADGNGAAVMFDAAGTMEAMVVQGGTLTRHAWQRGRLNAPAPLREYLAGIVRTEAPTAE